MQRFLVFLACFSVTLAYHLSTRIANPHNSRSDNQLTGIHKSEADPLSYTISYSLFRGLSANWSSTARFVDYSQFYPLLDVSKYATSFEEFMAMYPTLTIDTDGRAYSPSTFGDIGSGKFGPLNFPTNKFVVESPKTLHREYIIDYDGSGFGYYVGTKIGIGFIKNDTKLSINPFIEGYMTSIGAYTRTIDFGLAVYTLTFNPK